VYPAERLEEAKMRIHLWSILGAILAAAVVAGAAVGAGPWPGLATSVQAPSGVRYTASRAAGMTTVRATGGKGVVAARFRGAFGIPAVTIAGRAGGLSPDGRLLVLAQPPSYEGLREQSRFLVLSTKPLRLVTRVVLRGEFGFDAISPDRRMLYLTQHASNNDLVRYVVRAYDLGDGQLLAGAIVDKREPDEAMRGYPVARATSADGAWVYTLYNRASSGGLPFVHALDAAGRSAFCIDLPRWPSGTDVWDGRLELSGDGRELRVLAPGTTVARVDTKTLLVE
jgi:hypothetical protein